MDFFFASIYDCTFCAFDWITVTFIPPTEVLSRFLLSLQGLNRKVMQRAQKGKKGTNVLNHNIAINSDRYYFEDSQNAE